MKIGRKVIPYPLGMGENIKWDPGFAPVLGELELPKDERIILYRHYFAVPDYIS